MLHQWCMNFDFNQHAASQGGEKMEGIEIEQESSRTTTVSATEPQASDCLVSQEVSRG